MITAYKLPSLLEINRLGRSIGKFPLTVGGVVNIARQHSFSQSVIDFYSDFPTGEVFDSLDDFLARSEQVQIMSAEQPEMPWEQQPPQE